MLLCRRAWVAAKDKEKDWLPQRTQAVAARPGSASQRLIGQEILRQASPEDTSRRRSQESVSLPGPLTLSLCLVINDLQELLHAGVVVLDDNIRDTGILSVRDLVAVGNDAVYGSPH